MEAPGDAGGHDGPAGQAGGGAPALHRQNSVSGIEWEKAGSNPGLLLTRSEALIHLKICGTVNKEKAFAKRDLENACKNMPVNRL